MKRTSVKICGLQSVEVLKSIVHLPIDYVGFVFARSKRQVSGAKAAELIPILKEWQTAAAPLSVGVFVNPTLLELSHILAEAPLDIIQLHGAETPDFCREVKQNLGVKVFKALSVKEDGSIHDAHPLAGYEGAIDGLLLDTYDPLYGGGSGKTFAWERAQPYKEWAEEHQVEFLAAGGLHADNVEELIALISPDGVDVSSGVETDGVKDISKITAFVERVKGI
ncbi:phosphoribosylanthranilate isomerase [Paenibacillus fonticola]|uniref:phosphoribosylanthranilate isomerase n=1 Tax=Paenibacillus fonticola TaxID=379896 RepID=UPI0003738A92|nr:phosphoribosylanthranilate isomerase [Paenibacillus fonticola]